MKKIAQYTREVLGEATDSFAIVPAAMPGVYIAQVEHIPSFGVVLASVEMLPDALIPGTLVGNSGSGSAGKATFAFEANGLAPVMVSISATGDTETLGEFLIQVFSA